MAVDREHVWMSSLLTGGSFFVKLMVSRLEGELLKNGDVFRMHPSMMHWCIKPKSNQTRSWPEAFKRISAIRYTFDLLMINNQHWKMHCIIRLAKVTWWRKIGQRLQGIVHAVHFQTICSEYNLVTDIHRYLYEWTRRAQGKHRPSIMTLAIVFLNRQLTQPFRSYGRL